MSTASTPAPPSEGHLLRNMVLFGRMLRQLGLDVTPTQILDLLTALQYITLSQRADVKNAARAILVNHPEQLSLFDYAFELFWQARTSDQLARLSMETILQAETLPVEQEQVLTHQPGESPAGEPDPDPVIDKVYTYSNRELLRHTDFTKLSADELAEVRAMMREMVWELEQRLSRRRTLALKGAYLDMRRTFRQNLRYGGQPLKLARRVRKKRRRPLVVISDISGSMERYSRILLQFVYVISNGLEDVEAFVFSTRLTRITRYLRRQEVDSALDEVTAAIEDWAGGTRIGEALHDFNFNWSRRVLGRGAIVLLISDGWDRGNVDLLRREMERLQLSCQRLIWLNPLLGSPNYEPLTRGIQAALPFIDDFLPVHNLVSLEQLGDLLETLGERRPLRAQHISLP